MKIMLVGSMKFVKEMVKIKKELKENGHEVLTPVGIVPHLRDESFVDDLDRNLTFCINNDIMRKNFKEVSKADAVLVVNNTRNNIDGYIGASALLEMGIAYYLRKKIFLLNNIPNYNNVRWAHEVAIMQPVIIKGDLKKIK